MTVCENRAKIVSMYSIVIVDDESELLEGLSEFFPWESIGFKVSGAFGDAKSALKHCKDNRTDVVLTDIHMPFMDGLQLIKELKDLQVSPLFCIMSAYSEFDYAKKAIHYGVQEFLVKPAGFEEITRAFEKIRATLDGTAVDIETASSIESENSLITRTLALIEKRLSSCTLQNIAGELSVTDSYLSRLFKAETGMKFQTYLLSRKMDTARQMLESKVQYKNRDIASALGYQDTQNFCRTFRNYWGKSPKKFKEEEIQ